MNRRIITSRLTLSLSTLMLALLTACGGGGGDTTVGGTDTGGIGGSDPVVSTPVQPAAASTVCGIVATPITVAAGAERLDLIDNQTIELNSVQVPMRLITSLTGFPYDIDTQSLALPMEDLRAVMELGYTPNATSDTMGVEMGSTFAAGSVGCINSVSRITNNGTEQTPNYLLSWTSAMLTNVPMGSVPDTAVNGFEYTHNFTDKPADAVFRISKSTLADTSSAQICHINAQGSIDCVAPAVTETDNGLQWILKRPAAASGLYMLSAAREQAQNF